MNKVLRAPLTQEQKDKCHELLEDIINLYDDTAPSEGKKSEIDKYQKALSSLGKAGNLLHTLTNWAELQITTAQILKVREHIYEEGALNCHSGETEVTLNITEMETRAAIAIILSAYSDDLERTPNWKGYLATSLLYLNEGQVTDILKPAKTRKKGKQGDLNHLRLMAIWHVYRLWGENEYKGRGNKEAEQADVAKFCGVGIDAINGWEQRLLKEYPFLKDVLVRIKTTAQIRLELCNYYSTENISLIEMKRIFFQAYMQGIASVDFYESVLGGISSLKSLEGFPLIDMEEKLKKAGQRDGIKRKQTLEK